jgi:hypothetical protein
MKKFLTVLLSVAVVCTFSLGSVFATTDFNGTTHSAMQAGDYNASGSVTSGTAGAVGITDVERDTYVAELETALVTLDKEAKYNSKEYCGDHLTNVTNYVKEALEAAKVATTSAGLAKIKSDLATNVNTEKTKADLLEALKSATEYSTTDGDQYSITLTPDLAVGTYLLPGYGVYYNTSEAVKVVTVESNVIKEGVTALDWMLDNGYETKKQIESTAAKAAFEKALVKVSADTTVTSVYVTEDNVEKLTSDFVAAYYEWDGLVAKIAQTSITDLDAVVSLNNDIQKFVKQYGDPASKTDNVDKIEAKLAAAHKYYQAANFDKAYNTIKDLKSKEYVANKDSIVTLAKAIVAYEDKYDVETTYDLTNELKAIEEAGDDALTTALAAVPTAAESVLLTQKAAVETLAKAYDAYKAEYSDAIYSAFGGTSATTTDITVANEALIKALQANIETLEKKDTAYEKAVQAYLNNATVKVTTQALGNKKVRVSAKIDSTSYDEIYSVMQGKGFTVSYQFYKKTAKATSYKAGKVKDVNYTTFTGLKKGTKYNFQCAVTIKDANGNVIATKSYKGSTVGTRIAK